MAILEGGHIVPPPHSSYIQKPRAIRVKRTNLQFSICYNDSTGRPLKQHQDTITIIIDTFMLIILPQNQILLHQVKEKSIIVYMKLMILVKKSAEIHHPQTCHLMP